MDVNVAALEQLKEPTSLHNLELDLKQIEEKWHEIGGDVKKSNTDELVDELKDLERNESESTANRKVGSGGGGGVVGQPELDDTNYYNETPQPEVGQPTEQQIQREQQQIDEEIQGEINKDRMETMKVSGGWRVGLGGFHWAVIGHFYAPVNVN